MKPKRSHLSSADLRRVAVAASVDPSTVAKRLRGEEVRGDAKARADRALVALGFAVEDEDDAASQSEA